MWYAFTFHIVCKQVNRKYLRLTFFLCNVFKVFFWNSLTIQRSCICPNYEKNKHESYGYAFLSSDLLCYRSVLKITIMTIKDPRSCFIPVVMDGHHWHKKDHISWMSWHTGVGSSKMEKKKMCPRLLDYLVVVGARYVWNLTWVWVGYCPIVFYIP